VKPTVRYEKLYAAVVGHRGSLIPVDHPRGHLNGDWVNTSRVLSYDEETGRIETLNTVYVPV